MTLTRKILSTAAGASLAIGGAGLAAAPAHATGTRSTVVQRHVRPASSVSGCKKAWASGKHKTIWQQHSSSGGRHWPWFPNSHGSANGAWYKTDIENIQVAVCRYGYTLTIDGSYGPKTRGAVKAFQHRHGLAADGEVGPKTWGKLGMRESYFDY